MQDKNPITIVCINNNEYTIFTAVMLQSLFINYRGNEAIEIYILHDNLTRFNQNKLLRIAKRHKAKMHFILIDKELLDNLQISSIYTQLQVHYYKFIIPYILPVGIDRAIFLDSDMVVLEDISKLWEIDLGNNIYAAAQDSRIKVMSHDLAVINYKELGISAQSHYHNTGVMVIDLPKWRQDKISDKALECLEVNKKYVHHREQYALNIICLNTWKELDGRWNQFPEINHPVPYIYHYAGWWAKTLDENYKNDLPKEFFYYAKLIPWGIGTAKDEIERKVFARRVKVFAVKLLRKLRIKK